MTMISGATSLGPGRRVLRMDEIVDLARMIIVPGERRVLGITGAPGAGKSTVSAALLEALGDAAVVVGMDGFHLSSHELARLGRSERKGAPDTFDAAGYAALLYRLRATSGTTYAPYFDRAIEESIAGWVPVFHDTPLVITEGNYLLLADAEWSVVRGAIDEVWYLDVPDAVRRERLVRRRESFGHRHADAVAWVETVD